jgi:hypothetical protein
MQRSATHTHTHTHTTQRHSNAATHAHYQRTAAHGNQQCTHRNPTAPQLHTPLHCTPNMLVSTVVTHNGSAALQTRPRLQAAASTAASPHTQHLHHSVAVAVGSYTTAVEYCDCDVHDHRTCVTLVSSTDCQRPPEPPRQHTGDTAPLLQRGGNARVKQHSETHIHEQPTAKTIPRSAAPSHSSHSETRCNDAHATTQIRNRDTAAQHPTTAANARPKRAS